MGLVLASLPTLALGGESSNWVRSFSGVCLSSPSIRNSFVYVGSSSGMLHVFGQADGRPKWRYETGRRGPTAPIVSHGTVWLSQADGSIHALNAFTGRLLWKYRPGTPGVGPTRLSAVVGPVKLGGRLYQREKGRIAGIDARAGKLEVSVRVPNYDVSQPAVCSGSVIVGVGNAVHALAPGLDRVRWSTVLGDDAPVTPAVAGEETLFTATRRGYVFALDGHDGRILWKYSQLPSSPVDVSTDGSGVFVSTGRGNLYCLDAATGRLRWRFDTEGSVLSRPLASGSSLLFGSNDGRLYSVGLDDGRFEWSYDAEQEFVGGLSVEGDYVFVAASGSDGSDTLTRLAVFNINDALSSTGPFAAGRFSGRRADRDALSTVLVDSAIAAARRTASSKGLLASLGWQPRFLSAVGNPSPIGPIAERNAGRKKAGVLADGLACSAGTLMLTAGPGAVLGFLLLFVASAAGLVLTGLPLLGRTEAAPSGEGIPSGGLGRRARFVFSNRWMLGVAYGSEMAVLPVFLLARVVVGPGGPLWAFTLWMTVLWLSSATVSLICRTVLVKGAAEIGVGRRRRLRRFLPSPAEAVRLLTLYIVILLFATVMFILIGLAGVFGLRWLLIPVAMLSIASLPLVYADARIVLAKESIPAGLVAAWGIFIQRPAVVLSYAALLAGVLLVPAVTALFPGPWTLVLALALTPFASCLLAAQCVDIVDPDRRFCAFTGIKAADTIELQNGD